MLIYAMADIHGRVDRLDVIRENTERLSPDLLVVAGDLVTRFGLDRVLGRLDELRLPVWVIKGNGDPVKITGLTLKYRNVYVLHLEKVRLGGFDLVGIGGTVPIPFHSKITFAEDHLFKKLRKLVDKNSVLVAHPPPRGVLDEVIFGLRAGCRNLSRLIESSSPKMVICGHIHENPGWKSVGNTVVVNCSMGKRGAGALIEIKDGWRPYVEML